MADNFPGKRDELTDNYSLFDDYAFKLKFILKLINDYPYINNKFIILGLKNKFVDVRNMALDTLFNWNRESDIDFKDTDIYKELVKLKDEGYAITLAGDIARGKPEIAKLKFQEISKEAIYKANQESINVLKLQIKIIQNQMDKEWSNIENE